MEARWPSTVERCGWTEQPTNRAGYATICRMNCGLLVAGLLARSSSSDAEKQFDGIAWRYHQSNPARCAERTNRRVRVGSQRLAFNHHFPPSDPPILYPRMTTAGWNFRCLLVTNLTTTPLQRNQSTHNQRMHDERRWLVGGVVRLVPPSRDPYRYTEKR